MKAKILVYALPVLILTTIHVAEAQQPTKIPRIGYLSGTSSSFSSARVDALRQGLNELGYFEGKNIVIEYRFADGKPDRLPALAKELVGLKLDVVVATTTASVLAVKKASATIPIVVVSSADPIASGLVASLARPGGNITGLTILAPELSGKRLELLKEVLPKVTRVGVLRNPANPAQEPIWKEIQAGAQELRLRLQFLEVQSSNDLDSAFEAALRERAQALITTPEPLINAHVKRIVDFAAKNRMPAMYAGPEAVDAGGLMSYAPNYADHYRRAGSYVVKILKGAKPPDIPVEQPMKIEFVINLKAAKQIGLTIPPNVLARADKVIR